MLVNIDTYSYKLPDFVDRVPLLLIVLTKQLIYDSNIKEFMTNIVNTIPKKEKTDTNLETVSDYNKGISNTFSYIEEDDIKTQRSSGYNYLDSIVQDSNNIVVDNNDEKTSSKIDSAMFDSYKMERDKDVAKFFPKQQFT